VLADEPHHAQLALQLRDIQVAIDPVDALQLDADDQLIPEGVDQLIPHPGPARWLALLG
jgi:hypothetical protein